MNTVPIVPASQDVRIKQEPALIRTNMMQVPTSSEPIDLNGKGKNSRKRDRPTGKLNYFCDRSSINFFANSR